MPTEPNTATLRETDGGPDSAPTREAPPARGRLGPAGALAFGAAVLFVGWFGVLSVLRFQHFHSRSFDLAIAVRLLWGLRRGELFEPFTQQPWAAYHFEPVMLPLAAVDALFADASGLLVLQAIALALCAAPAFRLGERHLGGPWGGLAAAGAALLYPVLGQTCVWEFHAVAFALAPALWLFDALEAGDARRALFAAGLALACREDAACFVGLVALLVAPAHPTLRPKARWGLAVGCAAFYAFYAFVVKPRYAGAATVTAHFGAFGSTPGEVVRVALAHPLRTAGLLLTRDRAAYVLSLLAPLGFLSLAAPRIAACSLWTVAINMLSGLAAAHQVYDSHYSALAAPALIAAAIVGAGRVGRWLEGRGLRRGRRLAVALLVVASIAGAARWNASPGGAVFFAEDYVAGPRVEALDALLATVRSERSLCAPADVVAHLARRESPALCGHGLGARELVLLDMEGAPMPQAARQAHRAAMLRLLREAQGAGLVVSEARGPLVMLRRGAP